MQLYHITHNNKKRETFMSEEQHHAKKQTKITSAIYSQAKSSKNKGTALRLVTSHSSYKIPYCYIYRLGFLHFRNAEGKKTTHEQEKSFGFFQL